MKTAKSKNKHDKHHKKDETYKKKKRKEKITHFSSDNSRNESNEDSKIDLNEELHPIGYYVKDREDMITQMFKVIQGKKLKAMLPPILKEYSVQELKSFCLVELLGMSEKRIMSVLEGRELDTSSESDVHSSELENEKLSESSEDQKENWCSDTEILKTTKNEDNSDDAANDVGDMDTLEIGITRKEMGELLNDIPSVESARKKRPKEQKCGRQLKLSKPETAETFKPKQKTAEGHMPEQPHLQEQEREGNTCVNEFDETKGKTLLEILELEMRARAIRALLKQQSEEDMNTQSDLDSEAQKTEQDADTDTVKTAMNENDEIKSTDNREQIQNPNVLIKNEDVKQHSRKKLKKRKAFKKQNKNVSDVISNTESDNTKLKSINTEIEVVDLTKEKSEVMELNKFSVDEYSKPALLIQNDRNYSKVDKTSSTTTHPELQDKILCKDPVPRHEIRAAVDKTKRRCYRSNQEEGEISSDDENKADAAYIVKIESESDFDVITLDDSNDSIRSLPKAERHVTIENSNVSKLTAVSGTANQRLYSEVLRSNLKVFVKNRGKGKRTRDIHLDVTSSPWSKNSKLQSQTGSEANLASVSGTEGLSLDKLNDCERDNTPTEMSWAARWLKSKGVQKVVKTSKVCTKMRKRMKNAQKRPQFIGQGTAREMSKSPVHIIGSVKEYKMLDKLKVLHLNSKQKLTGEM